jgi:branched-subunit amino acid aminotransferase/4-amino-4-deoxychorismate lyase
MPLANEFGQPVREKPVKEIDIMGFKGVFFGGSAQYD